MLKRRRGKTHALGWWMKKKKKVEINVHKFGNGRWVHHILIKCQSGVWWNIDSKF